MMTQQDKTRGTQAMSAIAATYLCRQSKRVKSISGPGEFARSAELACAHCAR